MPVNYEVYVDKNDLPNTRNKAIIAFDSLEEDEKGALEIDIWQYGRDTGDSKYYSCFSDYFPVSLLDQMHHFPVYVKSSVETAFKLLVSNSEELHYDYGGDVEKYHEAIHRETMERIADSEDYDTGDDEF